MVLINKSERFFAVVPLRAVCLVIIGLKVEYGELEADMKIIARSSNLLGKITILIIVCLCVNTTLALDGSGTEQDPWRIRSLEDFNDFAADANYWVGFTRLETDVNLAGREYTTAIIAPDVNNSDWSFQGTAFTGVFEGNDHQIMELTIDDGGAGNDHLGLFGCNYGHVGNLSLVGGSVSGDRYVGGLCGKSSGPHHGAGQSRIENCSSTAIITGNHWVGGLVGHSGATVTGCYSTGSVVGNSCVGGLIGVNGGHGAMTSSYSTGSVSGTNAVGGLCGANIGSIGNCSSTQTVNGDHRVGGLCGDNGGSISSCTSTSTVSGIEVVGGLVGENYWGTITRCGTVTSVEGRGSTAGGLAGVNEKGIITESYSDGEVRVRNDNPYAPPSLNLNVGGLVGKDCEGGQIINCYSTAYVRGRCEAVPGPYFELDAGHVGGLVGYADAGTRIENCYAMHSFRREIDSVEGPVNVGGLVGTSYGLISNCFVHHGVAGYEYSGGLVGYNLGAMIDCHAVVCVWGHNCVGRVAGCNEGTISSCSYSYKEGVDCFGLFPWAVRSGCNSGTISGGGSSVFATWDFNTPTWTIEEGIDYPHLWWEYVPTLHTEPDTTLGTTNTISWEPITGNIEYYTECSTDTNFTNIADNSGWITETSYDFLNLTVGQQYWYSVKARNSADIESQWSNVESSLQYSLSDAVETLLTPESLKNKNMKNALLNKIDEALEMIEGGLYKDVLNKLQNDILQKTNGCAETGEPEKNDWILTCEEQSKIYPLVLETIEHVKSLIE
jgi:hypothetical protein